jgi:ABC-2 type transport system permease protein
MNAEVASTSLLDRLHSGWRCFWTLASMTAKSQLVHVIDAWLRMLTFALEQVVGLCFLGVVFTKVHTVAGWNLGEIVFLYALMLLSMWIYRAIFQGVRDTSQFILYGVFDQMLTKPRHPLLLMSCRRSNINGFGDLITGIVLLVIASRMMDYHWTAAGIAQAVVFVICSNVITIALMIAQSALAFWILGLTAVHDVIMSLREFCFYPLTICDPVIRVIAYTVIPLAFAAYVPAATMLAKDGFSWPWMLGPPAVAAVSLLLALAIFNAGLKRYEGAGS